MCDEKIKCPNCSEKIKDNQNFCTKCGAKLDGENFNKLKTSVCNTKIIVFAIIAIFFVTLTIFAITKNKSNQIISAKKAETIISKNDVSTQQPTPSEILQQIDNLQMQYFTIIKKHDSLLNIGDCEECKADRQELENLFTTVKNKINSNNPYLQKYANIEKEFSQNSGETTVEMNEFAEKEYDEVDKLLNDVYQEVKGKISQEDFKKLVTSELNWLKEVDSYKKVYDSQGFGTIGTIVYLGYQVNMRKFRTLLLMLYL